eukprot:m.113597 g.113597  ORF g.113597 m.113597 type:complete len:304 (+) comp15446_c0_seq31:1240-2151(+)
MLLSSYTNGAPYNPGTMPMSSYSGSAIFNVVRLRKTPIIWTKMAAHRVSCRVLRSVRQLHTQTSFLKAVESTSGGSGYADFSKGHLVDPASAFPVPLVEATASNMRGYATLFPATLEAYNKAEVEIVQWPSLPGRRPICADSGTAGGVREGLFTFEWEGDTLTAINEAVEGNYTTGRIPVGHSTTQRDFVLTREANYHPDGGQIVCPQNGEAFVALLALPNDDVTAQDFVAFYCDGSFGIHINSNVWHQPVFPIPDRAAYYGKQGAVHACVAYDSVDEDGVWLKVPLNPKEVQHMPASLKAAS